MTRAGSVGSSEPQPAESMASFSPSSRDSFLIVLGRNHGFDSRQGRWDVPSLGSLERLFQMIYYLSSSPGVAPSHERRSSATRTKPAVGQPHEPRATARKRPVPRPLDAAVDDTQPGPVTGPGFRGVCDERNENPTAPWPRYLDASGPRPRSRPSRRPRPLTFCAA